MNAEAERLLTEAMRLAHNAVMALERFREGAHAAMTADLISSAKDQAQIGEIYIGHLRCCWDTELDQVARARSRELVANFAETPF